MSAAGAVPGSLSTFSGVTPTLKYCISTRCSRQDRHSSRFLIVSVQTVEDVVSGMYDAGWAQQMTRIQGKCVGGDHECRRKPAADEDARRRVECSELGGVSETALDGHESLLARPAGSDPRA